MPYSILSVSAVNDEIKLVHSAYTHSAIKREDVCKDILKKKVESFTCHYNLAHLIKGYQQMGKINLNFAIDCFEGDMIALGDYEYRLTKEE